MMNHYFAIGERWDFEIDADNHGVAYRIHRYLNPEHREEGVPLETVDVSREDFLAILEVAKAEIVVEGDEE